MSITNVSFYSCGLKIAGNLYLPENYGSNRYPAIILCQGLSGVKKKVLPHIATAFAKQGFVTLAFDYRGCGDSEGDKTQIFPMHRVTDILHAIGFMRQHPNVDQHNMGLYGISYGGSTGLYAAALDTHVQCMVVVSGAIDGIDLMRNLRNNDEWLALKQQLAADQIERALHGKSRLVPLQQILPFSQTFMEKYHRLGNKNNSESLPDQENGKAPCFTLESAEVMCQFNVSTVVKQLSPRPILMIQGELDDVIPIEASLKIYNAIESAKHFIMIPGRDHIDLDEGPGLELQISHSLQWFKQYLTF